MTELKQHVLETFNREFALNLLIAVAIVIIGWVVAAVLGWGTRRFLGRTRVVRKIATWVGHDQEKPLHEVERWIGNGVYYLILLITVVEALRRLHLEIITGPINLLLDRVFEFAPQLGAAVFILFLAWFLAWLLKVLITKALAKTTLDERFSSQVGIEGEAKVSLSESLAQTVYWLILLLFLPAVLSTLELDGLLQPVQGMLEKILAVLPNALAAALILLVGWFIARIVRQIAANLLAVSGIDRLGDRAGLGPALGGRSLSGLIATVIYALVLIPAVIQALNALRLEAISAPATNMLNQVLDAVPALFAATLLLIIAYVVGRLVAGLTTNILSGVGFNDILAKLGITRQPPEGARTPSDLAGSLVLVAIMLLASIEVAGLLGFATLEELLAQFVTFAGQIVLGLVIFGVGLFLANLAHEIIRGSSTTNAGLWAQVARLAVVVLVAAMALRRMGIANEIVNLAFGLLLGAIAVAAALAVGLGSREIAGRAVEEWMSNLKGRGKPSS